MRGFESTPADLCALLPQHISRLGLTLEGSPVERYVQMLYRELERKGLRHFRPGTLRSTPTRTSPRRSPCG
jgi:hypothetical protein